MTCADLAKTLTAMCVRNAEIENIHAGEPLATKTGGYSDVKVVNWHAKVTHVNQRWYRKFGPVVKMDRLIGKTIHDSFVARI